MAREPSKASRTASLLFNTLPRAAARFRKSSTRDRSSGSSIKVAADGPSLPGPDVSSSLRGCLRVPIYYLSYVSEAT